MQFGSIAMQRPKVKNFNQKVAYSLFRFPTALSVSNLRQNSKIMKQLKLPQQPVLQILENCVSRFEPCTVYIFGHRNTTIIMEQISKTNDWAVHHFDLLVITSRPLPISGTAMANSIHELSGKTITATVLLHKPTELATKNPNQLHFFDGVLRYGYRLCLDKDAVPYIGHNSLLQQDRVEDKAFWLKCEAVALFSIQAAKEGPQQEVELCKIALLNTACVQIALGLIRVLMGYTPNEFGLKYLLQLCQHALSNPLPSAFNPQTMADKFRFNRLCAPPSMLNHWTKLNAPEEEFQCLLTATQQFLELSKELVNNH